MLSKLRQLIRDGEGLAVEFKRCEGGLANGVYETVSAFSNRYGGHIILGVSDGGEVCGVNPNAVGGIKKNFASALNNPERFAPTLFIALEEAQIDGKTVLWCFVPPNSQVVMFGGRIYDRAEDGDMDITRNSEMVAQIHRRKAADYSERKIFPFAKDGDFDFARLMPKVRRLAAGRLPDHPWVGMSDTEILLSAGLYQESREVGQSGYNLAAVLLFGRDDVIRSCTANYVTDAICRRDDADRYDDRLMVTTNLIDAYERLIEFIGKHTLDKFFLIGGQSVSVRSKIARELVSNILAHREYTSAYPAKIIIERDRIVTENWSLPKTPGRINPDSFTPYPKNPLLASFFINIGRADILGSGVRNLYKFSKMYSGGAEPELVDGDVFRTVVPLGLSHDVEMSDKLSDNGGLGSIMSDKLSDNGRLSGIMSDKMSDNEGLIDTMSDKSNDNEGLIDTMSDKSSDNGRLIDTMSDKSSDNGRLGDNGDCSAAILAYLADHEEISAAAAAGIIGRSPVTARRVLSRLAGDGVVVAAGANKNRKYRAARRQCSD